MPQSQCGSPHFSAPLAQPSWGASPSALGLPAWKPPAAAHRAEAGHSEHAPRCCLVVPDPAPGSTRWRRRRGRSSLLLIARLHTFEGVQSSQRRSLPTAAARRAAFHVMVPAMAPAVWAPEPAPSRMIAHLRRCAIIPSATAAPNAGSSLRIPRQGPLDSAGGVRRPSLPLLA